MATDDTDPALSGDTERLSLEVLRLRDLLRGAEAQIGELTTRLARLDEHRKLSEAQWAHRIEHTDRQLDAATDHCAAMEASSSWKIGQFVLKPISLWRAARRS